MPYKSQAKRRRYAQRWRQLHPEYMTQYAVAYRSGQEPSCKLGRCLKCAETDAVTPPQSKAEIAAGLATAK